VLVEDAADPASRHDFGKDVIPRCSPPAPACSPSTSRQSRVPGDPLDAEPYWRDVGTLDSYFDANMELRARVPALDLYNRRWRIRSAQRDYPPARFVRAGEGQPAARSTTAWCARARSSPARTLRAVVLGYDCFVHAGAELSRAR
jgi:glucose-1-phosphate adenylyltransferase